MKMMDDLKEVLEDELKKIAKKGEINPQELDGAYKAIDIIKDIATIKAMEKEYPEEGQSYRGSYDMSNDYSNRGNSSYNSYNRGGSYGPIWNQEQGMNSMRGGSYNSYAGRRGRDGDGDGQYSEDGSYDNYSNDYSNRRGRDARGRYTSRDGGSYEGSYEGRGYSRHSEKERMIDKLETMADIATDSNTKRAIEQCITKLES